MNLLLTNSNPVIEENRKDLEYCFSILGDPQKGFVKELRALLLKLLNDEEISKREKEILEFTNQRNRIFRQPKDYDMKSIIMDCIYNCYELEKDSLFECVSHLDKLSEEIYK